MLIGITGTIGAGKGTVVSYLVEQKGFVHYSVRAYIEQKVEEKGLTVNRDTLTQVSNELRKNTSPSYIVDQLIQRAKTDGRDAVIESIRTIPEAEAIQHEPDAYLFAVDAGIHTRYERIVGRGTRTDDISFDTFKAQEEREMQSDEPYKQNLAGTIARADYVFENSGSIDALHADVERVLQKAVKA